MFLRFQSIALDVSYGFGRSRSMFLVVVFLMKKSVYLRYFFEGYGIFLDHYFFFEGGGEGDDKF